VSSRCGTEKTSKIADNGKLVSSCVNDNDVSLSSLPSTCRECGAKMGLAAVLPVEIAACTVDNEKISSEEGLITTGSAETNVD
jgi:hypothetical protein